MNIKLLTTTIMLSSFYLSAAHAQISPAPLENFSYCSNGQCRIINGEFFAKVRGFPVNLNVSCKQNNHYALTFDDGPSANYPQLLEILKRNHVKASFFVIGSNLEKPEKVAWFRQAFVEGHFMANHTYKHNDLTKLSPDAIIETVTKTSEAMIKAVYPNPADGAHDPNKLRLIASANVMRPPGGSISVAIDDLLKSKGYISVRWNADRYDWQMPGNDPNTSKTVIARVRQQLDFIANNAGKGVQFNRSILDLNHDWQATTIAAVDELIQLVKSRGYEFVTLDVCLGLR